jgi:signal transduction histidine kinase
MANLAFLQQAPDRLEAVRPSGPFEEGFWQSETAAILTDAGDLVVGVNRAHAELFRDADLVPLIGGPFEDWVRALAKRRYYDSFENSAAAAKWRLQRHRGPRHEFEMKTAAGGTHRITDSPLPGGGRLVVTVDATAAKQAEHERLRNADLLQATFDHVNKGILAYDNKLHIIGWNRRLLEAFELPEDAIQLEMPLERYLRYLIGRGEYGVGDPEAILAERLALAQQTQGPARVRVRPNGTVLEICRNPMPGGGVVTFYQDVTERHRVEAELRQAQSRAEAASRAKSQTVAVVSHELRTPLNAIIGFAELLQLQRPALTPRQLEYLTDIRRSGEELMSLVNDLLEIEKIEAGKLELHEEPVEIGSLIESTQRTLAARSASEGVELATSLQVDLPVVLADARALKQVLLNLASNALKFTPRGGRVTISAGCTGSGDLVIQVSDTGIGIAPSEIARALMPYGQIDNELTRRHTGTGLGLPIAKRLCEAHGGSLTIQSELRKGTTVTVQLPGERLSKRLTVQVAGE